MSDDGHSEQEGMCKEQSHLLQSLLWCLPVIAKGNYCFQYSGYKAGMGKPQSADLS
jgi:hypothetical protein